ncbi:MAG: glycosyltransferase family 2 protein, partial [Pseudanabaena sp.]
MSSNKLVSILIPCYNSEKWIAETLKSALDQTWQNIEIILVDDG